MNADLIEQAQDQAIDATAEALSERIEFTFTNGQPSDSFWLAGRD